MQESAWLCSMGPQNSTGRTGFLGSLCSILRAHLFSAQDWVHHGSNQFLLASLDSSLLSYWNF